MLIFDYSPFFNYLKKNDISQHSLVDDGVISDSILKSMRHNKNIGTVSICRIMDYLNIVDTRLIYRIVEIKDDNKVKVREVIEHNGYTKSRDD